MFLTPNMGLTAWDLGTDPYDHSQLATNFSQLDMHDHSSGKGLQIPTAGIANNAITSAKIAANQVIPITHIPPDSITQASLAADSVGASELQDNAVAAANIIDSAITVSKLDPNIIPIGMVAMWYRVTTSILPPAGWEVMDGRTWSTITNKLGPGGTQWNAGNIPNMSNKFALGAGLGATGTTPSLPPDIGAAGGAHTRDFTHTHTTDPHVHSVAHTHNITTDGDHEHHFWSNGPDGLQTTRLFSRDVGVPQRQGTRQAAYAPQHNKDGFLGSQVPIDMVVEGAHDHGGTTALATPTTSSVTVTVNNGLTGDQDLRPAYVGLLFIMKVQ